MELAVVKLTLLGLALGAPGSRDTACPPDLADGQVCGSDFKTYENECWMQCEGAKLLWKGTCENPDGQPDSWLVHPVNDAEPPTPIPLLLETHDNDHQNPLVQPISPSTEDLKEPTGRPTDPTPVDLQTFTVHQVIQPVRHTQTSNVGPIYKLVITPSGKLVRPKNLFKGKSIDRKAPREDGILIMRGALAPYILGTKPSLGPDTPIFRIGSKPFEKIHLDTSLFSLLGLPFRQVQ